MVYNVHMTSEQRNWTEQITCWVRTVLVDGAYETYCEEHIDPDWARYHTDELGFNDWRMRVLPRGACDHCRGAGVWEGPEDEGEAAE